MAKVVKFGEINTLEVRTKSVCGFSLSGFFSSTTDNTPFTANLLNLRNIPIRIVLQRGGNDIVIAAMSLRELFAYSVFGTNLAQAFGGDQSDIMRVLRAAGVSAKQQVVCPFVIALPGIINLQGSDLLRIEVNLPTSAAGTNVDTTTSYLLVDAIEGVGVEEYVPLIKVSIPNPDVADWSLSCGDFVNKLVFMNYDKKTYLIADQVISSMQLTGDKYSRNDNIIELISKQLYQNNYISNVDQDSYNSFLLYAGKEQFNVELTLNFNAANVTGSNNAIIYSSGIGSPEQLQRALAMRERHYLDDIRKFSKS